MGGWRRVISVCAEPRDALLLGALTASPRARRAHTPFETLSLEREAGPAGAKRTRVSRARAVVGFAPALLSLWRARAARLSIATALKTKSAGPRSDRPVLDGSGAVSSCRSERKSYENQLLSHPAVHLSPGQAKSGEGGRWHAAGPLDDRYGSGLADGNRHEHTTFHSSWLAGVTDAQTRPHGAVSGRDADYEFVRGDAGPDGRAG